MGVERTSFVCFDHYQGYVVFLCEFPKLLLILPDLNDAENDTANDDDRLNNISNMG